MLDFKAELDKFTPIKEDKDVPNNVDINNVEDILDILRKLKKSM